MAGESNKEGLTTRDGCTRSIIQTERLLRCLYMCGYNPALPPPHPTLHNLPHLLGPSGEEAPPPPSLPFPYTLLPCTAPLLSLEPFPPSTPHQSPLASLPVPP